MSGKRSVADAGVEGKENSSKKAAVDAVGSVAWSEGNRQGMYNYLYSSNCKAKPLYMQKVQQFVDALTSTPAASLPCLVDFKSKNIPELDLITTARITIFLHQ